MGSSSFERGRGETPDRPRPEFLILWLEIKVVDRSGKMFGGAEVALHKCFVDGHLGRHVRQLAPLPSLYLLLHRLEVPLHPVNAYRDAVDQRERLRVFSDNGCEHTGDNVAKFGVL